MYRAIVFDLDDTLVNRREMMRNFFRMLLADYGDMPQSIEDALDTILNWDHGGNSEREKVNHKIIETYHVRLTPEQMQNLLYENSTRFACLMPYALETLKVLRSDYRISLITNGASVLQRGKIRGTGINAYLDDVLISEEIGLRKPMPEIYALCCSRLGIEPKEVLHVGDNQALDYEGPRKAGMDALLCGNIQMERGVHSISNLKELLTYLGASAK